MANLYDDWYAGVEKAKKEGPFSQTNPSGQQLNVGTYGATWYGSDPTKSPYTFNLKDDPLTVYKNAPQEFKSEWEKTYGADTFKDAQPIYNKDTGKFDLDNLYGSILNTNAAPSSQSSSISQNTSKSDSFSGLDPQYTSELMASLMPQLTSAITNADSNIDKYTQNAATLYKRQADQMMSEQLPRILNDMISKGLANSSITNDRFAGALKDISAQTGNKVYEAGMTAADMKNKLMDQLANVANLGKYSSSKSEGQSSSVGSSSSTDPTTMLRAIMDYTKDWELTKQPGNQDTDTNKIGRAHV